MWINAHFHPTIMWMLVGLIKPLQKNRLQRDDKIKRAPVKPQMIENHMWNMLEIWLLCLFYESIWGTSQSPHGSSQIWCFGLPPFFNSFFSIYTEFFLKMPINTGGWKRTLCWSLSLLHIHTRLHTQTLNPSWKTSGNIVHNMSGLHAKLKMKHWT